MRRSNHRPRASDRQLPLRALLALAALLVACAMPAQAQESAPPPTREDPQLWVQPADPARAPVPMAWTSMHPFLSSGSFTLPDGGNAQRPFDTAASLSTLLFELGFDMRSWSAVSVPRPGDSDLNISGQALFGNGSTGAGVGLDTDGVLKLVRSKLSEAVPAIVVPAADNVLRVTLIQDEAVTPSTTSAAVGQEIAFAATLPPGVDPATVTYEWALDDDRRPPFRTGESVVRHAYARGGRFNPSVTFWSNGRKVGNEIPPFIEVEIVSDEPAFRGYRPPEDRRRRATTSNRRGEGDRDAPNRRAPDDAPTEEPDTPVTDPGGYDDSYGAPAYTPPAATPPAATPPPAAPRPRALRRAPARRAAEPQLPQGETVDGYLLASATGVPIVPAALTPADQDLAPGARPREEGGLSLPPGVWVAGGLLLLVMLGWGLESRTTLPYFKP